jgi:hypothetical protein
MKHGAILRPAKPATHIATGLLLLGLALSVGCKPSTPIVEEKPAAPKMDQNEVEKFTRANGETVLYAGGKPIALPSGFPDDVPRYPKAAATMAIIGNTETTVILTTSDAVKKVETFYREQLKQNGWKTTADKPQLAKIEAEKEGIKLTVLLPTKSDESSIQLIVQKKKQAFD